MDRGGTERAGCQHGAIEYKVGSPCENASSFLLAGSPSMPFATTTARPRWLAWPVLVVPVLPATARNSCPVGNPAPPRPVSPASVTAPISEPAVWCGIAP